MEKYRDGQRELHCVFVDLEKAYDRVPREELWYCMRMSGVADKYVRVVQDMYDRSRTVVTCAVDQTEEFKVEVGLHQGFEPLPVRYSDGAVVRGGFVLLPYYKDKISYNILHLLVNKLLSAAPCSGSPQRTNWSAQQLGKCFMPDALPAATLPFFRAWDRHCIQWLGLSYSAIMGLGEHGHAVMPKVEETLPGYLSNTSAAWRKPALPSKPYPRPTQQRAGASLHTMAVLQAYQADLLRELDCCEGLSLDAVSEVPSSHRSCTLCHKADSPC
ncbi:hypothetical protein QTP70_001544 [Hemibagrus guttatus]|uniref:Reverse transcriptase domain-containing protein n=1 Tax=Hemibagrus guttatus TaxID=175788 RepID=A0AAE0QHW9_9TELE|nr:hypothetical protein QTP70_001544 [Hemibagrus guttatus]